MATLRSLRQIPQCHVSRASGNPGSKLDFQSNFNLLMPVSVYGDFSVCVCVEIPFSSPVSAKIQQEILLFKQNTLVSMSFGEDKGLDRLG